MKIEKMENWDILEYLRYDRNWMVQSHYSREDIEEQFNIKFSNDEEWIEFCQIACSSFDIIKEGIMNTIVEIYTITKEEE